VGVPEFIWTNVMVVAAAAVVALTIAEYGPTFPAASVARTRKL
jgi:hypothetical protein